MTMCTKCNDGLCPDCEKREEIIIGGIAHKIRPLEWDGNSTDDGEYHEWTTKRNDMQFEIIGNDEDGYELREQYSEIDWCDGFTADHKTIDDAKQHAERRNREIVMANFEKCLGEN